MINVAPLIVIVILYSRIMQALRKKINAGPLSDTNSKGKRCNQLQHIMKIFKSIVILRLFDFKDDFPCNFH